jgi:hypothetical protein
LILCIISSFDLLTGQLDIALVLPFVLYRKLHDKLTSFVGLTVNMHPSTKHFGQKFYQSKPNSASFAFPGHQIVHLPEPLENETDFVAGNAYAGVLYAYPDIPVTHA